MEYLYDFKVPEDGRDKDPISEIYFENYERLQYLKESNPPAYNRKVNTLTVDILDMDKYIKENELEKKQVTNPVFFLRGNVPTPDGLLSNEIFGITKIDRAGTFGWIDLKRGTLLKLSNKPGEELTEICYKQLLKLDKRIKNIVHHTDNYRVDAEGNLVEDEEKGETGIEFLQKNINKIKWRKSKSVQRDLTIRYIEKNKKKMFITKYPVIPAYYRDVEVSKGKTDVGAINKLYASVLGNVKATESITDIGFFDNTGAIKGMIQEKLLQIYNWFIGNEVPMDIEKGRGLSGKLGIIRMANASKTTDYSSRLVLSSANLKAEFTDDIKVNIDTAGIPLAVAITNYKPYVLFHLKNFFLNEFSSITKYPVLDKKGNLIQATPKDPLVAFSDERLEEEMARFIHGYQNRFIPIMIEVEELKDPVAMRFMGNATQGNIGSEQIKSRILTWCDVLYMAAVEATKDKYILMTRYPIESAFNQVPNKVVVLSTTKTEPMYINDKYYPYYPHIEDRYIGMDSSNMFEDTLQLSNTLLQGMCGDQSSKSHYSGNTVMNNQSNCWKNIMSFRATA